MAKPSVQDSWLSNVIRHIALQLTGLKLLQGVWLDTSAALHAVGAQIPQYVSIVRQQCKSVEYYLVRFNCVPISVHTENW